jgi:hypothetical protein
MFYRVWQEYKARKSLGEDVCFFAIETEVNLTDCRYPCHVMPRKEFKSIMTQPLRCHTYHEMIPPDEPCRLYLDCEPVEVDTEEAKQVFIDSLKKDIYARLRDLTGDPTAEDPPCLILDASRLPLKCSFHMIFPTVWFQCPRHIKSFLEGNPNVDLNVYWLNAARPFRLPYNWKIHSPSRKLIPVGEDKWAPFNFERMIAHCVSLGMLGEIPKGQQILSVPEVSSLVRYRSLGTTSNDPRLDVAVERILAYLVTCYGEFTHSAIEWDNWDGWSCEITPSIFCPMRAKRKNGDGYHRSHRTYIGSRDWIHVYARCPSVMCRVDVLFLGDFSHFLYQ